MFDPATTKCGITKRGITRPGLVAVAASTMLSACSAPGSMLSPAGSPAHRVETLWWFLLWISLAVFLVVIGLMVRSVVARRVIHSEAPDLDEPPWASKFIVITGVILPSLILTGAFLVSLADVRALADDPEDDITTVRVIGHMWWWEAEYPNGAVTANEIHIPVGEPVRFELETADVIHSFWIPALGPKRDLVPGQTNRLRLDAEEAGRYRGQCAEFCGLQHAHMGLFVVADPDFEDWVEAQAQPAEEPETADGRDGRDTFLRASCAGCHAIRGTPATADVGPDLTHLASRETIGAASFENTHENLTDFVANAQSMKPGVVMPPAELSSGQIEDVVAYLETLR